MNAPRRVTLCVDDFGLHAGIDAAVFDLARRGRLGAVSCLVGLPRWHTAGRALAALDPDEVDVGLHLDLTESPLDASLRRPLSAWIARTGLRAVPRDALRAEIVAQLDAFEAVVGRAPAHVDGHQHVHQLPVVRELLVDVLARRYRAADRPWLRCTRPPRGAGAKARLIGALGGVALERLARARGFASNARLLGVHGFDASAAAYRARLEAWLAAAGDGDLLMCHPSRAMPAADDPILPARLAEAQVLCSDGLPALLDAAGVTLAPLSHRPASP